MPLAAGDGDVPSVLGRERLDRRLHDRDAERAAALDEIDGEVDPGEFARSRISVESLDGGDLTAEQQLALDQGGAEAPAGGVVRGAKAGDAAADYEDVVPAAAAHHSSESPRQLVCASASRVSQSAGRRICFATG